MQKKIMELMKYHISNNGSARKGWSRSAAKVRYVPPAHKYSATGVGKTFKHY